MEATIERNEGTDHLDPEGRPDSGPHAHARVDRSTALHRVPVAAEARTLQSLLDAWSAQGAALPIAVVQSIIDDLLGVSGGYRALDNGDVIIDANGFAHGTHEGSFRSIASLLVRALTSEHQGVPPSAEPLMNRLEAGDLGGSDQLRSAMRDVFGPPASHEEVSWYVAEKPAPEVELPADVEWKEETSPPEVEVELSTLPPATPPAPTPPPATAKPIRVASTLPQNPSARPHRPVVRHHWKQSTISLPKAPAARRSARHSNDARDVLAIPGDRNPWVRWTIALMVAIGLALIYLELR
jgi:hypothetical protein